MASCRKHWTAKITRAGCLCLCVNLDCSAAGAKRGAPSDRSFGLAAQLLSGLLQGATDSDGAQWRSSGLDRLALDMAQRWVLGQGEVPADLCRSLALLLGGSGSLPLGHKCAEDIVGRLCTAVGNSNPGVAGCVGAAASAPAVTATSAAHLWAFELCGSLAICTSPVLCARAISWTSALLKPADKRNAMSAYAEVHASSPALDVLSGCLWSAALAGQLPEDWVEAVATVFILVATEVSKYKSMRRVPECDVSIASVVLTACTVAYQARWCRVVQAS